MFTHKMGQCCFADVVLKLFNIQAHFGAKEMLNAVYLPESKTLFFICTI